MIGILHKLALLTISFGFAFGYLLSPLAFALVTTTCPTLTGSMSDWEKIASYLPGSTKPATQAELQQAMGHAGIKPLMVGPATGLIPLEVTIRWWWYPVENAVRLDFDVDGDGQAEWSQPGFNRGMDSLASDKFRRTYTYKEPGRYQFTVHAQGSDGQVETYSVPIKVISLNDLDLELQSRWTAMKSALRSGNIEGAIECILSNRRDGYRRMFNALIVKLKDIDGILKDITLVEPIGASAEYEMLRPNKEGTTLSYLVRFNLDLDGVWRISTF